MCPSEEIYNTIVLGLGHSIVLGYETDTILSRTLSLFSKDIISSRYPIDANVIVSGRPLKGYGEDIKTPTYSMLY